ncbi:recombinase family protein [Lientehia hominis]|uniref:recombinase family protein n=1 Tax=Lientehia hominis TaxID=2897778 RepID=UPI002FE6C8F1
MSTDQEEQLLSYENQVRFYTESINSNPEYECAGMYADEGISGTNTKKRDEFKRMILDCLNYVRELKGLGIGVTFEKEAIDTLDAKSEVLLIILSSLAQDERRNISENSTWGIRKRFEIGQHKMSAKRFFGYDADENGKLVMNKQQAKIMKRIFEGVINWDGGMKWQSTTIGSMLENEKYKGDMLLQKSHTVDFLTKKRVQNGGESSIYCR